MFSLPLLEKSRQYLYLYLSFLFKSCLIEDFVNFRWKDLKKFFFLVLLYLDQRKLFVVYPPQWTLMVFSMRPNLLLIFVNFSCLLEKTVYYQDVMFDIYIQKCINISLFMLFIIVWILLYLLCFSL